MSLLFISDLHLAPERPQVTEAFYQFIDSHALGARALYILGDLFEVWIGDDDPSDMADEVQRRLAELSASGTQLFIQHGNRDFLLNRHFMRRTGATLLPDRHVVEDHGRRLLLMHGDQLCTDDRDYQRFRRKARNPIYRWVLAQLPLARRQKIATEWRRQSHQENRNKPSAIMDVNQAAVRRVMQDEQAAILIHGHTHRPARHTLDDGQKERIVLGDWERLGWCLRSEQQGLELLSFAITTPAARV